MFPDNYLHIGGDEVSFDCWSSNPNITAFMDEMGFGSNYNLLESYYITRLLGVLETLSTNNSYVVWQEIFDNGVAISDSTVVEVWKDPYLDELYNVTAAGYQAILSTCWYLDYISYGSDWTTYYQCEPLAFNGTGKQNKLVVGGEACLWAEFVDGTNLTPRLWPRASAVAERLWSPHTVTSVTDATPRMEEHRCRMLTRGVNAEPPSGPGHCAVDYMV
jgi:hexosaminidase